ncbi:MAG: hypothetical protein O7D94_05115 [Planctomycetota bacterium]|nr:hypothetical protein [Planctomycetota bacterium]
MASRSIGDRSLRYADPLWLKKLMLGVLLMLGNIPVVILASTFDVLGFLSLTLEMGVSFGVPQAIILVHLVIQPIIGAVSTFLLTSLDPGSPMQDYRTGRWLLRGIAIVAVVWMVLDRCQITPAAVSWIGIDVCGLVLVYGKLRFLHHLAGRIPDKSLRWTTTFVQWGLMIGIAYKIIAVDVYVYAAGVTLRTFEWRILVWPLAALLVLFGACYCGILIRYFTSIRKALREACVDLK